MTAPAEDREKTPAIIRMARIVFAVIWALLVTLVLAPSQLLAIAFQWRLASVIPQIWFRLVLPVLGIRLIAHGKVASERPLLLVANHVSWTDIPVLGAAAPVSFVAKADMRDWPVIKRLTYLARTIFVEREKRHKSGEQAGEIARRLAAGDPLVLFPEGTTGDGNYLFPFKSALLSAAQKTISETGLPEVFVQPVAVIYTRQHGLPAGRKEQAGLSWIGDEELVPHFLRLVGNGGIDAEVVFGPPMTVTADTDRKLLTRELEARVREMFVGRRRSCNVDGGS